MIPRVREDPEFYYIDPDLLHRIWKSAGTFREKNIYRDDLSIYHAVGNLKDRTDDSGVNIKIHARVSAVDRSFAK